MWDALRSNWARAASGVMGGKQAHRVLVLVVRQMQVSAWALVSLAAKASASCTGKSIIMMVLLSQVDVSVAEDCLNIMEPSSG